jgi:hypothetical protein
LKALVREEQKEIATIDQKMELIAEEGVNSG